MIFNLITVFLVSKKIYKTHRIQFYLQEKKSTFGKILLEVCFLLQFIGHVTVWTFIFFCLEEFAFMCITFTVLISWLEVKFFLITNLDKDRILWRKIESKAHKARSIDLIYWTAIISSWITPVTVWYNHITDSYLSDKERNQNTSKRKLFLLIMSSTTIALEFIFIGIIALIINFSDILPLSEGIHHLQCVRSTSFVNETTQNFSWIKFCTFNQECQIETRMCANEEQPINLHATEVILKSGFILLLVWIASFGLQIFGKNKKNFLSEKSVEFIVFFLNSKMTSIFM